MRLREKSALLLIIFATSSFAADDLKSKYDVIGGPKATPQEIAAKEAKQKAEEDTRDFAKHACINYVQKNINDPSSAQFPKTTEDRQMQAVGVKQKNGTWKVTFTGRARNQFNAMIIVKFQCIVEPIVHDGTKSMMIVSAKQLGV